MATIEEYIIKARKNMGITQEAIDTCAKEDHQWITTFKYQQDPEHSTSHYVGCYLYGDDGRVLFPDRYTACKRCRIYRKWEKHGAN